MGTAHAQARHRCEQIQEWISLALDCDLSRIESALVERHLGSCADCTSFARDVGAFTTLLRAAELEPLERPITLPQRTRRVSVRSFQVAVAAAVAVAAVGVASLSNSLREDRLGGNVTVTPVSSFRMKDRMRERQLQQLTERIAETMPRPVGPQPV